MTDVHLFVINYENRTSVDLFSVTRQLSYSELQNSSALLSDCT